MPHHPCLDGDAARGIEQPGIGKGGASTPTKPRALPRNRAPSPLSDIPSLLGCPKYMRNEAFGSCSCAAIAYAARANAEVVVRDPHTGILTFEIGTVLASALFLLLFALISARQPTDGTLESKP
jgi:hypothetical protein